MSTYQSKKNIAAIRQIHREIAGRIEARMSEFRGIWKAGDDTKLFIELVFCLLTPQSGARRCWLAVENLLRNDCLFSGGFDDICGELNIVRFKNHKTSYILEAREAFLGQGKSIRKILQECGNIYSMREWIAGNVKGLGYKEASHYLRNIGLGDDIAILDRHILRNMYSLRLIDEIPNSISSRLYYDMEKRLCAYSKRIDIPLSHLDFVLWYKETGDIFK
jgi:N-glycosylase/DNA lyase